MINCSPLTDDLTQIYLRQWNIEPAATRGEADHSRCELETTLGLGVVIYENIRHRHLSWYADVEANRIAYEIDDAQRFADEYRRWMAATEHWVAQVEQLQLEGFDVARACEIQKLYEELKLVDLDVRELASRYQKLEQGGGIEAGEFFASLRPRESA